ncbi:MAG: type II toxin-antitoxin system RelE/ParE family toxin [Pseudomonadota bacterium]
MIVTYTRTAERHIEDFQTWSHEHWGREQAVAYLNGFIAAVERLRAQPQMGRLRRDIAPNVRSVLYRPYTIYYVFRTAEIRVIGVVHERRDQTRIRFDDD